MKKFINWLYEHGHTVDQDNPFIEEIKEQYKKKSFTYDLAFELSLSKYLLSNPLENFFIINEWIYAPHYNEIEERSSNINKDNVYKIMQDYLVIKLSNRDNIPNISLNISENFNIHILDEFDDCLMRKISKQKDNIDSLIDSKPVSVDLNIILGRIAQVYHIQYSSE